MSTDLPPQEGYINAPLEKAFNRIITPFEEFIHKQTTGGLLLFSCAVIAMVIANSHWLESYQQLLHAPFTIGSGDFALQKSVQHWINDGLMALFFFLVGLEIKREVLVGELADIRQASLPIVAAIGGMIVPASIYFSINQGSASEAGWGIPMATDIAFAVGALVILGSRIPRSLLTFLVALAIVDDLGAVVVIALFYTEQIALTPLAFAALLIGMLVLFNLGGIRRPLPYFIIGALLWLAMLKSGIHATLAGVLTALAIPARSQYNPSMFSNRVRGLMDRYDTHHQPGQSIMSNDELRSVLQTLKNGIALVESPLQRLEHSLHMPVAFVIIPLFALANAGIPIDITNIELALSHPATVGVFCGLVLGKVVGIAGFSWIAIKLGIGQLPAGTNFQQIIGVALLGGIGFTMSIFIAELAFASQPELLLLAKTGILCASMVAGILGLLWLLAVSRQNSTK